MVRKLEAILGKMSFQDRLWEHLDLDHYKTFTEAEESGALFGLVYYKKQNKTKDCKLAKGETLEISTLHVDILVVKSCRSLFCSKVRFTLKIFLTK